MFTPEFSSVEEGKFILVANHYLESLEGVRLSIAYNKARIAHGFKHVPRALARCRLVYDIWGQAVAAKGLAAIRESLAKTCELEFIT